MAKFDLLIQNGQLIDTANDRLGHFDVALAGGCVADVAPELNPDHAGDIFDATGKLVFPQLLH